MEFQVCVALTSGVSELYFVHGVGPISSFLPRKLRGLCDGSIDYCL